MVKIFWDFLLLCNIFTSQQVKRSVSTCNKQGLYELAHELPNELRLRILKNEEMSGKSQKFIKL